MDHLAKFHVLWMCTCVLKPHHYKGGWFVYKGILTGHHDKMAFPS